MRIEVKQAWFCFAGTAACVPWVECYLAPLEAAARIHLGNTISSNSATCFGLTAAWPFCKSIRSASILQYASDLAKPLWQLWQRTGNNRR